MEKIMNKKLIVILLVITALLLTGCPKNEPKLGKNATERNALLMNVLKREFFPKEWLVYQCAAFGTQIDKIDQAGPAPLALTCTAQIKNDPELAKSMRNQILDNSVGLIDSAYGAYIRNLRQKRSIGEFMADLLFLGGNTAVGIVNGERALQVLGVALTGASGARKSANINLFDEKTTNVLIKQMNASRSAVLSEVNQQKDKSAKTYSFDQALTDMIHYFEAGTLNQAFVDLDTQATLSAEIARLGVLKLKDVKDVKDIVSVEKKESIVELDVLLTELDENVYLNPAIAANTERIDKSTAFLKAVWDKIAADTAFSATVGWLKGIPAVAPGVAPNPTLTRFRQNTLAAATAKITNNQPLNGKDYYALVNESLNYVTDDGPLYAKLLEHIKATQKEKK